MTSFASLSALARAMFALWSLLLCLAGLGSAALAAVRKRFLYAAAALTLFIPVYFLWQVIFDLSLQGTAHAAGVSRRLGALPWTGWFFAFAALTVAALGLFSRNIRCDRNFITPGAVKQYLDRISCGVCCWRDSGRVLFSNTCMNRLCKALTGGSLLSGDQLREAAGDGIVLLEDRVWRFSGRYTELDGEPLHELIASDITAEYARTQVLERDKAELSRLNRELGEYYASLDDIVRRQEILQAKANIHDEMNRLMLATAAAGGEDEEAAGRIFSLWEQDALLLCREAEETADAKAQSLEKLAAALKIQLVWEDALPDALTDKQKGLFFAAASEAVVNAVKHAKAQELAISFSESENQICCRFASGGDVPAGPVRFTGGLANLVALAERQDASVTVASGEVFALMLHFPRESFRTIR